MAYVDFSGRAYIGISGTAKLSISIALSGSAEIVFSASGKLTTATISKDTRPSSPTIIGSPGEVGPGELMEPALKSITHTMTPAGQFQLTISPSGDFELGGPADEETVPKLGFKRGDKIRLSNTGEANHGREFTIFNPDTVEVFEQITLPDSASYDFELIRRST